jgi:RNA polymerase sigma-70 factor (ECF subfamily)
MTTSKSLLLRAGGGDEDAWRDLVDLYRPLVRGWLVRFGIRPQEADDLSQDVLMVVVRELPTFRHNGHTGAFRSWLRNMTVNRSRTFCRTAGRERAGCPDSLALIDQLEDAANPLAGQWDREHDEHVVRSLLDRVGGAFEAHTVQAFRLLVLEQRDVNQAAAQLSMTPAAVYRAKARVLQRLRTLGAGLLD